MSAIGGIFIALLVIAFIALIAFIGYALYREFSKLTGNLLVGAVCDGGGCENGACGFKDGTATETICCPSGETVKYQLTDRGVGACIISPFLCP